MRRPGRLAVAIVAVAVIGFAQTQVATITSDGPFQLRGANVAPEQGVPSWPVLSGDTIKAGDKPLTVTFEDGSQIVLAPGSSAKVDLSGKTPIFQLETGSAHYSLKALDSVKLMTLNKPVTPKDLAGNLQNCQHRNKTTAFSPAKMSAAEALPRGSERPPAPAQDRLGTFLLTQTQSCPTMEGGRRSGGDCWRATLRNTRLDSSRTMGGRSRLRP
jgi:hypothetical protein